MLMGMTISVAKKEAGCHMMVVCLNQEAEGSEINGGDLSKA